MDHYNGIVDIMQNKDTYGITVENIVISKTKDINDGIKEIINTAYENEVNIIYINKGERLGDFTCLWPGKDVDYESENGKSQVLSYDLNNGKTRILFMGDYDGDEDVIVENMYKYTGSAKCDILKVAHHGSKYGTSNNFLKSIEPEIAIISCSKYNNYGHPSPEVIERLKKNGCETYITKDLGEIEILLKE